MSGKGSTPRPREVSREEYERRWAETFGKRKRKYGAHPRSLDDVSRAIRETRRHQGPMRDLEHHVSNLIQRSDPQLWEQCKRELRQEDTDGTRSDHVQG